MSLQAPIHSKLTAQTCFKCGEPLAEGALRYLGHDWCRACARSEAELRLERQAAKRAANANGDKPAEAAPITELPATLQTLLRNIPNTAGRDARSALTTVTAVGGPALLLVGIGVVIAAPSALVGPTLTLSGAILISAVVRRR